MRHPRKAGDRAILNKINERIKEAVKIIEQLGYEIEPISSKEFFNYMTGETPTGDVITLNDVLNNEFLMVHEVVEISELKKMNVPIDKHTVMNFYPKVYEAHFVAIDYELTHALTKREHEWFKRRFVSPQDFLSQLDDPYLPPEFKHLKQELAHRCKSIIKKFSKYITKA